ncbi:uncharacterized protein LOC117336356 isoform X2 [Pecten maximus]|uniref:uncharacterized protein LOC117336356 isoform X2 n=1 Tax=Pecten maximus TaxID=6579 RepID=UPI001457FFBE|nr:uncharacterized protein LOC117336356 isoform X2 [Pecten maximus]
MGEIPYHICEDDDDSLICTEIECHSLFDRKKFLEKSCEVEAHIQPIECFNIKNGTVVLPSTCFPGHDYGHNDSFIHVREGCAATFKACTESSFDEISPSSAPPVLPSVGTPTTRNTSSHFPFKQPEDGNDNRYALTAGLAVGIGLVVVIAVVVMVIVYYRRQKSKHGIRDKNGDSKKTSDATPGDHVYTDITTVEETTGRREEIPGDYVTISDEVDKYDHCRQPPLNTERHSETTDTYDTLKSQTTDDSVIGDQPYDTTRDNTYDRLHAKEKSSIPGNYDVLPVPTK